MPAKNCSRKSGAGISTANGSRSLRGHTTDDVLSSQSASKLMLGCTLYRYIPEYWQCKGKPFLHRSLSYQLTGSSSRSRRKRKPDRSNSDDLISKKRLKMSRTFPTVAGCSSRPMHALDHQYTNGENGCKPTSLQIIFDAVYDHSGTGGYVDLNVLAIKSDGSKVFSENSTHENGHSNNHSVTLRVPRNPPWSSAGTNGHVLPFINIVLDGRTSYKPMNGTTVPSVFANTWILCQCKMPLPRTGRKGLRNSIQRRANAASAPLSTDCCYGCFEVDNDKAALIGGKSQLTIFLKRLQSSHSHSTEDGNPSNGHTLSRALFMELLADNEFEGTHTSNMPTLKLRIISNTIQNHRPVNPDRANTTQKRNRLNSIAASLPREKLVIAMDSVSDINVPYCPVYYHICLEQQRNGTSYTETYQNGLTTKLDDPNRCPFCSTKCPDLYALLQHHRCCHPRFSISVKESGNGSIIDIRPSTSYDGRLETRIQRRRRSKRKVVPVKRSTTDTKVIFYRPHSLRKITLPRRLEEFKNCSKDGDHDISACQEFMLYHARQYYHSQTCQKLLPEEFDRDSEDEMDPAWLRDRTERLIDEFSDVNEGEKAVMKLWNLHVLKNNYFNDKQMIFSCQSFLIHYGPRIIEENLVNNFLLHLADLYYFGLLSQAQVFQLSKQLQAMKACDGRKSKNDTT